MAKKCLLYAEWRNALGFLSIRFTGRTSFWQLMVASSWFMAKVVFGGPLRRLRCSLKRACIRLSSDCFKTTWIAASLMLLTNFRRARSFRAVMLFRRTSSKNFYCKKVRREFCAMSGIVSFLAKSARLENRITFYLYTAQTNLVV